MGQGEGPVFLSAWESREQAQPATGAPPPVGPRPRYVQAALDGETAAVRGTPKGARNGQLNTSALKLGRLVGAGLLDEQTAVEALRGAALDAGLEPRETARTIASGLRAGIADPRDPGSRATGGRCANWDRRPRLRTFPGRHSHPRVPARPR
jgi:hypothetical protein